MKLDDIKWAVGTLVSSALHGPGCNCPRHARMNYDPARGGAPEKDGREKVAETRKSHGNVSPASRS